MPRTAINRITLTLPYPPSVNHYWQLVRGRLTLSTDAKAYKQACAIIGAQAGVTPIMLGTVAVEFAAYRPRRKGDLDNVQKALFDAIKGIAYRDDSQIVKIVAERYDDKHNPRIEICIYEWINHDHQN